MTLYYLHGFSSLSPSASDLEFCRLRLKPSLVVCVLEDKLHGKSLVLKVTGQEMIGSSNSEDHQSNILSPPRMLFQDPKKLAIGFTTLRDLTIQLLQELEKPEEEEPETIKAEPELAPKIEDVEMEDGETTELEADKSSSDTRITFAKVENGTIVSGLSRIKTKDELITPLIRTLGGKHGKIISLIQNCQSRSEALILRVLLILAEKGKLPASIVEVIKSMSASSNNLLPRFIIPTIGDLKKAEIMHHVLRIITLLNGSLTERGAIRLVFESIIQQPPLNFGSVSANAPRVKHSELLTPVELLVLLHRTEEGGYSIKQAIEAIGICFLMTEIFKPVILAAFMQQVVDKLTLPTLFLRTVDSEEDLGSASAMGRIYEMCKDNCTSQFWCPLTPRSIW
ncbi:Symplekin tight junction protein C terminal-domain-containing protein [Phakopsora pachyrhizi]|uniref:Symplekin tight junction protein C terminal-domain-containing protein n=1 Tax=Phakopsora pachyrhizi TaxID=170000 RepID=A0AAV0BLA0_PHAPC|nr:Symplekin tight junction protein C terminal-domain-containing protein [Phakopsora pachyrhizi]